MAYTSAHETVLKAEAVDALSVQPGATYIDTTFGRGGHSQAILDRLGSGGKLLVMDRDPEAIAVARELSLHHTQLRVRHGTFSELSEIARAEGVIGRVAGILFDLGVSSPQLDDAERGFSFSQDGPLDMRMDPTKMPSAAEWINSASEKEIARVLFEYGEERHSRRMARRILEAREEAPITTTGRLTTILKAANPAWEREKHPATRAFQGIRIFINSELDQLRAGLEQALSCLAVGGRLVVISFHSLEDRMVKKFIAKQTKGDNFPRDLPVRQEMLNPTMKTIGRLIKPGVGEISSNPRARSAVMRVAEKIA